MKAPISATVRGKITATRSGRSNAGRPYLSVSVKPFYRLDDQSGLIRLTLWTNEPAKLEGLLPMGNVVVACGALSLKKYVNPSGEPVAMLELLPESIDVLDQDDRVTTSLLYLAGRGFVVARACEPVAV